VFREKTNLVLLLMMISIGLGLLNSRLLKDQTISKESTEINFLGYRFFKRLRRNRFRKLDYTILTSLVLTSFMICGYRYQVMSPIAPYHPDERMITSGKRDICSLEMVLTNEYY
jgi:hypothetical protein